LHSPYPLAVRAMLCGIGGIALGEFAKAAFGRAVCQLKRTRTHSAVKQLRRASAELYAGNVPSNCGLSSLVKEGADYPRS
jgi:hypothetical protein